MKLVTATLAFLCRTPTNAFSPIGSRSMSFRHSLNTSLRNTQLNSEMKSMAEKVLANPQWPEEWPYTEQDLARMDESQDSVFYESPRL